MKNSGVESNSEEIQEEEKTKLRDFWRRFRRNKPALWGLVFTVFILLVVALAPYLTPYDYRIQELTGRHADPSSQHLLGTDHFGRDLFSRVIIGARVSVGIGFAATFMVATIGFSLGLLSGFFGGKFEWLVMRTVDVLMSVPGLFLMIVIVALFGASLTNTIVVIGLTRWSGIARLARAETKTVKNSPYLEAAEATGARTWRIIVHHVIPNVAAPVIVWVSLFLGRAILIEAGLSYLGLGAQPPLPSWGNLVAGGQEYLRVAWWQSTVPGLCILFTVLSFNLVGDGLRDALDPKG